MRGFGEGDRRTLVGDAIAFDISIIVLLSNIVNAKVLFYVRLGEQVSTTPLASVGKVIWSM